MHAVARNCLHPSVSCRLYGLAAPGVSAMQSSALAPPAVHQLAAMTQQRFAHAAHFQHHPASTRCTLSLDGSGSVEAPNSCSCTAGCPIRSPFITLHQCSHPFGTLIPALTLILTPLQSLRPAALPSPPLCQTHTALVWIPHNSLAFSCSSTGRPSTHSSTPARRPATAMDPLSGAVCAAQRCLSHMVCSRSA